MNGFVVGARQMLRPKRSGLRRMHSRSKETLFTQVVCLASLLALCSQKVEAQYCYPNGFVGAKQNGIVANCADTIVLQYLFPIPPKSPNATEESPIHMWRDKIDSLGDLVVVPVKIQTFIDHEARQVKIKVLDEFPVFEPISGNRTIYTISIMCRWWDTEIFEDSVIKPIQKNIEVNYRTEARMVEDSSLLDTIYTMPIKHSGILVYEADNWIEVREAPPGTTFSHWTTSDPGVTAEQTPEFQVVSDNCWPVFDTVTFTAWFEKTTKVNDNEDKAKPTIRWINPARELIVSNLQSSEARLSIFNVQGSVDWCQTIFESGGSFTLPLSLTPGVHLAVIEQHGVTTTLPFIAF